MDQADLTWSLLFSCLNVQGELNSVVEELQGVGFGQIGSWTQRLGLMHVSL